MARSEESILRRALKRENTEAQQRQSDRNEMKRQALKVEQKKNVQTTESDSNKRQKITKSPPSNSERKEGGMSKSYDRRNNRRDTGTPYSRNAPRSEMRGRKPPSSTPRMNKTQQSRHDKETSKKLVWDRQADTKTLSKNQEVRQRYKETSGDGMDAADVERAKLLIARDQRKQEKMKKKKKQKEEPTETNGEVPIKSNGTTEKEIDTSTPKKAQEEAAAQQLETDTTSETKKGKKASEAQAKRDQNKALRLLYLKTDGKGMREDQIERAKLLIARDEKKKERRAQKEAEEKQ
jgi:hypothetical protein